MVFKHYILFCFFIMPSALVWGADPSGGQCMNLLPQGSSELQGTKPRNSLERRTEPEDLLNLRRTELENPPPAAHGLNWLERLVASEPTKVVNFMTVMKNTDAVDLKHEASISALLKLVRENPALLSSDAVRWLFSFFEKSMNESLSKEEVQKYTYNPQTARNFLEILLISYHHREAEYLLDLFKKILEYPDKMRFAGNPSRFEHIPIVSLIMRFLKNDVDLFPELLTLFKALLTRMLDPYTASPNTYMNQPVLIEKAVESIVSYTAQFVSKDPRIMESLFERLSMLYSIKHPVRFDHALIEYRHTTIESIIRELRAGHIFSLTAGSSDIREAVIVFFTRDFHHPSKEILDELEKFLALEHAPELQTASIKILAARELAGETAPYAAAHFESRAKWVQSPRTAPSRLTPRIVRKIRKLAHESPVTQVRSLAQEVMWFVEIQDYI